MAEPGNGQDERPILCPAVDSPLLFLTGNQGGKALEGFQIQGQAPLEPANSKSGRKSFAFLKRNEAADMPFPGRKQKTPPYPRGGAFLSMVNPIGAGSSAGPENRPGAGPGIPPPARRRCSGAPGAAARPSGR